MTCYIWSMQLDGCVNGGGERKERERGEYDGEKLVNN